VGLLGPNGAGKTTILRLLSAAHDGVLDTAAAPDVRAGGIRVGQTVAVGHLSQALNEIDPLERVLEALKRESEYVDLGKGRTLTAQQLLENFGFVGDKLHTRLGDLSGGELRRLQFLRLLVGGPNVLLLDEPTNDLDVEMLTVLEDLLDTWPGTLIVVSHDRYFLERTTDNVYGLLGDGKILHLVGGVDEYLERRLASPSAPLKLSSGFSSAEGGSTDAPRLTGGDARTARKELTRVERRVQKLDTEETRIHAAMADAATNHELVSKLDAELRAVIAERHELEEQWMALATELD